MSEPPREHHVNFDASNELRRQARRARRILERIAKDIAASEPRREEHWRDLVERSHVLQAAQLLFGSTQSPAKASVPRRDIFISYSSRNKTLVHRLCKQLEQRGLSCFVADQSIRTASNWVEELWRALAECRARAIILTRQSVKSQWCSAESGAGIVLKIPVVPVLRGISQHDVPDHLKQFQSIVVNNAKQQDRLITLLTDICR